MQNRKKDNTYDVIIIGAGGLFGSSALYHAAKIHLKNFHKSPRILGIEQFEPNHTNGSSHGESRITRIATGEGPEYVKLAQRSHEIWEEIQEATAGKFGKLCQLTGGLIIASAIEKGNYHGSENGFLQQTRACAQEFKISHRNLSASELRSEFPQYNVDDSESGYFEDSMGFICPDACIKAQLHLARQYGAEIHEREKVLEFGKGSDGKVRVLALNAQGEFNVYQTKKLILAAGAWIPQLLKESYIQQNLNVYRQTVYWFEVEDKVRENYAIGKFLPFIWDGGKKKGIVYGFPIMEGKFLKIGSEQFHVTTTPSTVDRTIKESEVTEMYEKFIKPNFNGITNKCVKKMVCLYTVAPKHRFIVDYLPEYDQSIIVVSACSGHGAKHSAAMGEAVAQTCLLGKSDLNIIQVFGGLNNLMKNEKTELRSKL